MGREGVYWTGPQAVQSTFCRVESVGEDREQR